MRHVLARTRRSTAPVQLAKLVPRQARRQRLSLAATEVESNQHPALLEREDCTLVAWYRSLYAPRTGGAYDSHHRTAGIACRTLRGGSVAARGACAAGDAGGRLRQCRIA